MSVLVVGAINVDLVVATDRLPGPGETVLGSQLHRYGGGKGANAAVAAAAAGARVRLVSAVGDDPDGRAQLAELVAAGVDTSQVAVRTDLPTGAALIVVGPDGQNQITVAAGPYSRLDPQRVAAAVADPWARLVLVSTEVAPDAVRSAVMAAAERGVPCLLNPAPVRPELADLLPLGPVLTPNEGELGQLAAVLGLSPAAVSVTAAELAARSGSPVIVTLGEAGALIAEPGVAPYPVPAPSVRAVDATGAGDAFNGVLAAAWVAGESLPAAVHRAVLAASATVTRAGARSGPTGS